MGFPFIDAFLNHICEGFEDRRIYIEMILYYIAFRFQDILLLFIFMVQVVVVKVHLLGLLSALTGIECVTTSTPQKIHNERFEVANFNGIRLVLVNDKEGSKLKFTHLKSLSGGDLMSGEIKYKRGKIHYPPNCVVCLVTNDPLELNDNSGATKRRYRPFPINRIPQEQKILIKWNGIGWEGLFATELGAFAQYLFDKYKNINVGDFIQNVEQNVPSLSTEFEGVIENCNPLVGFVKNYLQPSKDPNNFVLFGWTMQVRAKKEHFSESFDNLQSLTLVSAAKEYYKRINQPFNLNDKTFRETLGAALELLQIPFSFHNSNYQNGVYGLEWNSSIQNSDFEINTIDHQLSFQNLLHTFVSKKPNFEFPDREIYQYHEQAVFAFWAKLDSNQFQQLIHSGKLNFLWFLNEKNENSFDFHNSQHLSLFFQSIYFTSFSWNVFSNKIKESFFFRNSLQNKNDFHFVTSVLFLDWLFKLPPLPAKYSINFSEQYSWYCEEIEKFFEGDKQMSQKHTLSSDEFSFQLLLHIKKLDIVNYSAKEFKRR
jgi:hypothetical protein